MPTAKAKCDIVAYVPEQIDHGVGIIYDHIVRNNSKQQKGTNYNISHCVGILTFNGVVISQDSIESNHEDTRSKTDEEGAEFR